MDLIKPRYIAVAAITLDGKIAEHEDQFTDWTSREDKIFLHKFLDKSDVVVVGRNTYETAKKPLSKRNCIVLTRSVKTTIQKRKNLLYLNPQGVNIQELIRKLGYNVVAILGGTQTYTYFLKKGLLDEMHLTIEPIIFGSGLSIFDAKHSLKKVKIISVKKLNSKGTILIHAKLK